MFFERKKKGEVELAELFQDDLAGERGVSCDCFMPRPLGTVRDDRSILSYTVVQQNFCGFLN